MTEPRLRPLTPDDADDAVALVRAAFDAWARAAGEEPQELPEELRAGYVARMARFPVTDPEGSWAVDGDEGLIGVGVAVRREHLWGLALLFVDADHQSRGVGRRLLEATRPYAEGATVELIMASEDPRAIRRYASLGLGLHPGVELKGAVERSAIPGELAVRAGSAADLELVEAVDRELRGVGRTDDIRFTMEALGAQLLVADRAGSRGFVLRQRGTVVCLGATDEATAQALLWAALAEADEDEEMALHGLTAPQRWAFDVALRARMSITPGGPMFVRGWPALPGPYLPSGVYF